MNLIQSTVNFVGIVNEQFNSIEGKFRRYMNEQFNSINGEFRRYHEWAI